MAAQVTNRVVKGDWSPPSGALTILKPRSQLFSHVKTDNARGAGADEWATTTWLGGDKFILVTVGFDDANSVAALMAELDQEGALVVEDRDANSRTVGRKWTWNQARLSDVQGNQLHEQAGEFVAIFICRSADGTTGPLVVSAVS